MKKRTIKKVKYTGKLLHDSKAWALVPRIACETVGECNENTVYLYKRLARVYKYNPTWGKNLAYDGERGRAFLYSFLTHWLTGYLVKGGALTQEQAETIQKRAGCFGGGVQLDLNI